MCSATRSILSIAGVPFHAAKINDYTKLQADKFADLAVLGQGVLVLPDIPGGLVRTEPHYSVTVDDICAKTGTPLDVSLKK